MTIISYRNLSSYRFFLIELFKKRFELCFIVRKQMLCMNFIDFFCVSLHREKMRKKLYIVFCRGVVVESTVEPFIPVYWFLIFIKRSFFQFVPFSVTHLVHCVSNETLSFNDEIKQLRFIFHLISSSRKFFLSWME